MQQLGGKLALVTGGAKNIGGAVARELALRGAHVLVNFFHSPQAARQLQDQLRAAGARVDLIRASVARQDQVDRMFQEIEERFGYLDILVNNAADGALLSLDEITDDHLDKAIDTNYKGSLRCARAAAPLMSKRGGGSIIQLSALGSSQMVMANYLACAPAKAAAEAVTRYLAVEYAPLNIRVNTASAAMLESEVADAFPRAAEMQEVIRKATPLGRLGTPADFAAVVAFLASDDARWITGQVVLADGGLSLGAALMSPPATDPVQVPSPAPVPAAASEAAAAGAVSAVTAVTAVTAPPARAATQVATVIPQVTVPPQTTLTPQADATEQADAADEPVDDIAIVGMGLAVAGANSPEEFWQLRTDGAELFVPVPQDRWQRSTFYSADPAAEDKSYQDTCVFITDFRPAEGALDGLPNEGSGDHELTTTWLRHSLVQALEGVHRTPQTRFSFLVGYTPDGSQHLEEAGVLAGITDRARLVAQDLELTQPERDRLLDSVHTTLANRYWRGAQRPSRFLPHRVGQLAMAGVLPPGSEVQMVDTACSSSLYAIDIGVKGLQMGKQDIAVCGGAFALAPRGTVLFSKLQGLSKRGRVHSFDATADGVIFADGAGVVILKRLRDAQRDGDRILGVLKSFGASSDGKGKAIYAPNSAGQDLAVRAALSGEVQAPDVDWIIAHATGTPAGDLAEFTTLRKHFGKERTSYVTSNKSLIGHTGWAAGVVSVIEAVLAMRHGRIPKQFRYESPQQDFQLDTTDLRIPQAPVEWPADPARPRTAAISGFGFGGTNAHLVVQEPGRTAQAPSAAAARPGAMDGQRVAIVAWSAHVPGLGRDEVQKWLGGAGAAPGHSFGARYPTPPFKKVRLPPATVRTIDRCQLMILECAHDLRGQLSGFWDAHTASAGVFVGNMGPTRAAMLFANRCFLDDVATALNDDPATASLTGLKPLLEQLCRQVRTEIPPSNEDAFPGMMPNVISARVANYFDLKGPNITLDAGLASGLTAIETACRYLRTGELDFALAGGINGNSLPEYRALIGDVLGQGGTPDLAEGAFMFTLTTEATARAAGLPVLGYVDGLSSMAGAADDGTVTDILGPSGTAHYLGAAGSLATLRALHGPAGRAVISCANGSGLPPVRLELTITDQADDTDHTTTVPAAIPATRPVAHAHQEAPAVAASPSNAAVPATAPAPLVAPHVPVLTELADRTVGRRVPFLPPGVVVLTDLPDLGASLRHLPPDATVISTAPADVCRPGWRHLPEPTPQALRTALQCHGRPVRHLRVVTDLSRTAPLPDSLEGGNKSVLALHDAAFLALQTAYDDLAQDGSSFLTLLLGGLDDSTGTTGATPHPFSGLFSGLVKCAHLEFDRMPGVRPVHLGAGAAPGSVAGRAGEHPGARLPRGAPPRRRPVRVRP